MSHDKTFWDTVYSPASYTFGRNPSSFLETYVDRLTKGRALDIAMGEGRNAIFLAKQGFTVTGIDFSPKATQKALQWAKEEKVSFETKTQDLDFYLFPIMAFETIIMTYYKPLSRLYSEIKKSLVPGGTVLCEAYLFEQGEQTEEGLELSLEECYSPNELLKCLNSFHLLYYEEGKSEHSYVVRAIAKKPTDKDAIKYGFISTQSSDTPISSHEKRAEKLFKPSRS